VAVRSRLYVIAGLAAVALAAAGVVEIARRPRAPLAAGFAAVVSSGEAVAAAAKPASTAYYGPTLSNRAAYIPLQCYATTRDESGGRAHNGCFVCHQESRAPNYTDDSGVQSELSFASYATKNRWTNTPTPAAPAVLSDAKLLEWVRTSNYIAADAGLALTRNLANPIEAWDTDHDGSWGGFVPDCWFRVDESGYDQDPQGKRTGWRAYSHTPVPGMFWPTNGSAGDVFIRLPEPYRLDSKGVANASIYGLNLAIAEAYVKRVAVPIPATDERSLDSDLDGDGVLGTAKSVAFVWPPKQGRPFHFVGKAAELDAAKDGWPVAGLYPRGTEFLHSVRYLDVVAGVARMAARLKELRYMRKTKWLSYGQLEQIADAEKREKFRSPDKLKRLFGDAERGVSTGTGWVMQGFIEDVRGELRPQSFEETIACIGCHGGVGATTDSTFSFARKLGAGTFRDGWYHPSERDLKGVPEPKRADGTGEYAHFLAEVGGGDDFRSNDEVRAKFFRANGRLDPVMAQALARDISVLVMPSAARALALDRAYLGLVQVQNFLLGRDVLVGAAPHVESKVVQNAITGIQSPVLPAWKAQLRTAQR
jgi:hypothetical protein